MYENPSTYRVGRLSSKLNELERNHKLRLQGLKREISIKIGSLSLEKKKRNILPQSNYEQILKELNFPYRPPKIRSKLRKLIPNKEIKKILRRDIESAVKCLYYKLYKPCVILCGGVIEGILQEKIENKLPEKIQQRAIFNKLCQGKSAKKMDDWSLKNLLDVSENLKILATPSAKMGHGIRNYRNYIHPKEEIKQKHPISSHDANIACQFIFKLLDEVK